ncbi:ribose transporter RbsU [Fructilactobacillus lindneri]|nr:GRP family sugar transporter [Fructilactobacillus lindneri]ANZ57442.1 ribose transporter RbsU [Fructilactobacillus lindneri]ANZ58710.1 ribose transporter RbsU [Fructilactobacillus lindneri]POG97928.1 ribose transporter RbsU [Fructilactobacillus lindneri]POG99260.1 ribose transporter RbsU [Fructilactobacillus lindneri]POH01897.1 ribose transporter RbsU [Fructilactobacillus lindneri]
MNLFALLIGIIPVIGWGFFPTISSKIGGKPSNQIFGATIGALIIAFVVFIVTGCGFPMGWNLVFGILSGCGWGFGQIMAFKGYSLVGSSRVMPITTAFQLIVTALWGAFALSSWPGIGHKVIGILALIVIIIGATLTTWTQNKENTNVSALKKAVIYQLIGVIGYWLYSAAPQVENLTWAKGFVPRTEPMSGLQAFLPQAIGMVLIAIVYSLMKIKEENVFKEAVSYKQIIAGFFFGIAALAYLVAAQPQMLGMSTAFVISQVNVVIATLTGIYWLHQRKTSKEMVATLIGLALIIVAAAVTAFL